MSKIHLGLRRAGFAGAASALALAGALVVANSASAAVPAGALTTVGAAPNVMAGQLDQHAADVKYVLTGNTFSASDTVTFQIKPHLTANDCTGTGAPKAVAFTGVPSVTIVRSAGANANVRIPASAGALNSSSATCSNASIKDIFTVTLLEPAGGATTPADHIEIVVGGFYYTVGSAAPRSSVAIGVGADTTNNATVTDETAEVGSRAAAPPSSHGNAIPPLSYRESGGAQFATGTNAVTLSLSGGDTFTPGVTPQVTGLDLPSDYTISAPPTTASPDYTFTVKAPATVAVGDFVFVSGLKVDTSATLHVTTLTSKNDRGAAADVTDGPFKVLNVLNFDQRFGGDTRYGTAAKLFEALSGTQDTAVVASGEAFPDALGANVLASKDNSGLLMTRSGSLPSETKDAIIADNVKKVYLLGGTGAVSAAVENEIADLHVGDVPSAAHVEVVRVQGIDRYATNRAINAEATPGAASTVLVASGKDFPDALALGPISYNKDLPLILTNGTSLTAGDIAQLNRFNPSHVVIAGGTAAVSTDVETAIEARGIQVSRIGGDTRYDTAANIARWATTGLTQTPGDAFLATGLGFSSTAGISLGTGFADALAAGALLGEKSATLLLTSSPVDSSLGTGTYLREKKVGSAGISDLLAIGATDVVSAQLMEDLAATVEK